MASEITSAIAVTGASGFLGRSLTGALAADGVPVRRLVRRPAAAPDEVPWDPDQNRLDPARLEGISGLVHLAGVSIAGGLWTAERRRRILESRVKGTGLLARTLAGLARPPSVWVCPTAVGYFGDRGGEVLSDGARRGTGFLADVVVAWEAAADPARQAGIRVVHPRFGVVLDPTGGMLRLTLPVFRLGLGGPLGNGAQWMSWTSLREVVRIVRFLIETPAAAGPMNATSPTPVTNAEFTRTLAGVLRRPAFCAVPAFLLEWLLGDLAREALLASTRAVPGRLLELGYRFEDSLLDPALRSMLSPGQS